VARVTRRPWSSGWIRDGVSWTHLHPHMFMENLLSVFALRDGRLPWPAGDKPTGWIAGEDLASVAAKVLTKGPDVHTGKGYWMSTEVLNGVQAGGRRDATRRRSPNVAVSARPGPEAPPGTPRRGATSPDA
jgi:hypothetical protein